MSQYNFYCGSSEYYLKLHCYGNYFVEKQVLAGDIEDMDDIVVVEKLRFL